MADFSWLEWAELLILMVVLGGLGGFMAGLLGVGGGVILVPGIYFIFTWLGFEAGELMHVAVGTSLAIIILTGWSSARAHYKKGAVRFDLVKKIGIGIVIGVGIGTLIADRISGDGLKMVFAVALFAVAAMMQINPEKFRLRDDVPAQPWPAFAGGLIGILSTLMGIGGATMNVPYMTLNGIPIRTAVGTASALGPIIAIPGSLGFILIGLNAPDLPPFSLGYISLPALAIITPISVLAAPWGAHVAHKVSVGALRRIFSIFIVIVAAKMFYGAIYG